MVYYLYPIPNLEQEYQEKKGRLVQEQSTPLFGKVTIDFNLQDDKVSGWVTYTNAKGLTFAMTNFKDGKPHGMNIDCNLLNFTPYYEGEISGPDVVFQNINERINISTCYTPLGLSPDQVIELDKKRVTQTYQPVYDLEQIGNSKKGTEKQYYHPIFQEEYQQVELQDDNIYHYPIKDRSGVSWIENKEGTMIVAWLTNLFSIWYHPNGKVDALALVCEDEQGLYLTSNLVRFRDDKDVDIFALNH